VPSSNWVCINGTFSTVTCNVRSSSSVVRSSSSSPSSSSLQSSSSPQSSSSKSSSSPKSSSPQSSSDGSSSSGTAAGMSSSAAAQGPPPAASDVPGWSIGVPVGLGFLLLLSLVYICVTRRAATGTSSSSKHQKNASDETVETGML